MADAIGRDKATDGVGTLDPSIQIEKCKQITCELVGTQAGTRRNSTFSTENYRSDGRTSSVAAEPPMQYRGPVYDV